MAKKWKVNKTKGKYKVSGEALFHAESGALVGTIFPEGSEIVADVVANMTEDSEELDEVLEGL